MTPQSGLVDGLRADDTWSHAITWSRGYYTTADSLTGLDSDTWRVRADADADGETSR